MKKIIQTLLGGAILGLSMSLTSCEDILGEWSKPAPAVSSVTKSTGNVSFATTSLLRGSLDPRFTNALTLTGDGTVTYASSDPAVATVDPATGKVTPVGPGTATITATISDSETYTYATKQISYTLELQEGCSYREWNVGEQKYETKIAPSANCEVITAVTNSLADGKFYMVKNTIGTSDITLGNVNTKIILCDNAALNVSGRIYNTAAGTTLTIYAQSESENMGQLNVTSNTGTESRGVIDITQDASDLLTIHGGKISAIATGNTTKLGGIKVGIFTVYGGDVKAQANETGATGDYGIWSSNIFIHGGKVEGIGGNSTGASQDAGTGICGQFVIDGDAVVIATGGNATGTGNVGGYGIWPNSFTGVIGGNAKVTATGGNSTNWSGGAGMQVQGSIIIQEDAQVIVTGGDNLGGANGFGGQGTYNGTLTLSDQASLTIRGGKSTGDKNGVHAIVAFEYKGGTFTAIGGTPGPTGIKISAINQFKNSSGETVKLEYSVDGSTWPGTFADFAASDSWNTLDKFGIRKTN